MRSLENELIRRKEIHEYITTTHMFCFLVMLFAFALSQDFFDMKDYGLSSIRFLVFCAVGFIIFELIVIYNNKSSFLDADAKSTWFDLLYISGPLIISTIALFVGNDNAYHTEAILLIPVIITSSVMGKRAGLAMAVVSTVLIFAENTVAGMTNFFSILESNIILICVMLIVAWFVGAQTDFDKLYRLRLERLARTDLLTGLYNYGYFQEKLSEYAKNASLAHPLSLIIIDIDSFKHYNDIHGHQAGDMLIKRIGDIINAKVSNLGFAARYGGDEYMIVLPRTDTDSAMALANELCAMIRSEDFPGEEYQPEGEITVSCGTAVYPTHAANIKDLIRHADLALYRAKNQNKNRVEMYFSVFDHLDVEGDEKDLLHSFRTLVSVINAKDRYTYGHSERVTDYAMKLGREIGLSQEEIHLLGYAAFLHDIGKIEVDWQILNKSEPLDEKEWEMIKHHPEWGSEIVKALQKLHPIVPVILHHHENYDGSGYPAGLKGNDIPLLARIIRVADSFDAITSLRPYREPLSVAEALKEIRLNAGTQLDPQLAEAFIKIIQDEMARQ